MISIKKVLLKLLENDSWHRLTLTSDVKDYSATFYIIYKKTGNIVNIQGAVSPTGSWKADSTEHIIGTLPEGYRPTYEVFGQSWASGFSKILVSAMPNGNLRISRRSNNGAYVSYNTNTWLPFSISYYVN